MVEFLVNLRCYIGIHRYQWKTEIVSVARSNEVHDRYRCTNVRCRQHRWRTANVEQRRPW
jgi:hypothetical protein